MSESTATRSTVEITPTGKVYAGIIIIGAIIISITFIIGYWPNKMPAFNTGDENAWYQNKLFNINLVEKGDCLNKEEMDSLYKKSDSLEIKIVYFNSRLKDSIVIKDSALHKKTTDSLSTAEKLRAAIKQGPACKYTSSKKTIHLNTLLLLLIALVGFLGNLIHMASSFAVFVGNGAFKRSWLLWYIVKPFTAAGLALVVYFVIRAGFLNYGSGANLVNLYGLLALSALTGFFTEVATLKLEEVFNVIFKPKDERTGKLHDIQFLINAISPDSIPATGESSITISGKNFNTTDIIITVDGKVTAAIKTDTKIEFKYSPTPEALKAGKMTIMVTDKDKKPLNSPIAINIK